MKDPTFDGLRSSSSALQFFGKRHFLDRRSWSQALKIGLACLFFTAPSGIVRGAFEPEGVLGIGVRALGMGGAFTALADDPSIGFWNPAGILRLAQTSASLGFERQLSGKEFRQFHTYQTLVFPLGDEALSFSNSYLKVGDIGWEMVPQVAGAFAPLKNWAVGFGTRFYLGSYPGPQGKRIRPRGMGFDIGVHKIFSQFRLNGRPIKFGASILNLGAKFVQGQGLARQTIPWQGRLGFAWSEGMGGLSVASDITFRKDVRSNRIRPLAHLGVERWFLSRRVATRVGVSGFQAGDEEYSAGFGIHIGNYEFDYAYLSAVHDLGANHRFGVSLRPRPAAAHLSFRPKLFSPNGDGRKERTQLIIRMRNPHSVMSHHITIFGGDKRIVWEHKGSLAPPGLLRWDGLNEDGEPVPDGDYIAKIVAETPDGKVITESTEVKVDTLPPRVNLDLRPPILKPNKTRVEWVSAVREENGVSRWTFEVRDRELVVRGRLSGEGVPPNRRWWDGGAGKGSRLTGGEVYNAILKVRDKAENEGESPVVLLTVIGERPSLLVLTNDLLERGISINVTSGDVLFDSGTAIIQVRDESSLKRLADMLKSNPEIGVVIEGHTDNVPIHDKNFANNLELSKARADSVALYVISNFGVDPTRIRTVGYADARPIASNETAEGRKKNRRIEALFQVDRDAMKDIQK